MKAVSLHLHLDPPVRRERVAQQPTMLGQRADVRLAAELAQHPRRALDIREEERHRAGRKLAGSHGSKV
jgi:hypothetical protein